MWRYKIVHVKPPAQEESEVKACEVQLNELGRQGWEMVAVLEQAGRWSVVFKMPHEVGTF